MAVCACIRSECKNCVVHKLAQKLKYWNDKPRGLSCVILTSPAALRTRQNEIFTLDLWFLCGPSDWGLWRTPPGLSQEWSLVALMQLTVCCVCVTFLFAVVKPYFFQKKFLFVIYIFYPLLTFCLYFIVLGFLNNSVIAQLCVIAKLHKFWYYMTDFFVYKKKG